MIVDIVPRYIRFAEQHYNYQVWSSNYAREIRLTWRNGLYNVEDRYKIYGWMEVQDNNELKPLDSATIKAIAAQGQPSG